MSARYAAVSLRAGHRCEYCHAPEAIFNFPFEVEHILPSSRQGPDDDTNLALACRACNLYKTDHTTAPDEATQSEVRLFHPRQDRWEELFEAERETGIIRGLTPIGRATVLCLRTNTPLQLEARRQWMRLGLFP
jgi:hypothetical protein